MRKTSERGLAFLILVASACIGTYSYANQAASTKENHSLDKSKCTSVLCLNNAKVPVSPVSQSRKKSIPVQHLSSFFSCSHEFN